MHKNINVVILQHFKRRNENFKTNIKKKNRFLGDLFPMDSMCVKYEYYTLFYDLTFNLLFMQFI